MSQHFIRKLAGYGPIKRAYLTLYEPRVVSAMYGWVYAIAAIVGVNILVAPPLTLVVAANNPWLLWLMSAGMTGGGIIGAISVACGNFWVERYGATLLLGALIIYWVMLVWLTLVSPAVWTMTLAVATFAIAHIILRFHWIRKRPFDPDKSR